MSFHFPLIHLFFVIVALGELTPTFLPSPSWTRPLQCFFPSIFLCYSNGDHPQVYLVELDDIKKYCCCPNTFGSMNYTNFRCLMDIKKYVSYYPLHTQNVHNQGPKCVWASPIFWGKMWIKLTANSEKKNATIKVLLCSSALPIAMKFGYFLLPFTRVKCFAKIVECLFSIVTINKAIKNSFTRTHYLILCDMDLCLGFKQCEYDLIEKWDEKLP